MLTISYDWIMEYLCCPFCSQNLTIKEIDQESETGILSCVCSTYPIIFGIPILKKTPETLKFVELIISGKHEEALALAIMPQYKLSNLEKWKRLITRILLRKDIGGELHGKRIAAILNLLSRKPIATFEDYLSMYFVKSDFPFPLAYYYLLFRRSSPTFLSILAFLQISTFEKAPILDLCCGCGHITRNLTTLSKLVFGVDGQFLLLFLAKKIIAPQGKYICVDVNSSLPFHSNTFRSILCADALFDVTNMQGIVREMERVSESDASIVCARLLNRLVKNLYRGSNPLSPVEYAHLFSGFNVHMFSESAVLKAYLESGSFDIGLSTSADQLSKEPSVALVAQKGGAMIDLNKKDIEDVSGTLALNPEYKYDRESHSIKRCISNNDYKKEYILEESYLPKLIKLTADQTIMKLKKNRVLLSLPENYASNLVKADEIIF